MLWVKLDNRTHQVVSYNIHESDNGVHEVWIERATGKGLKIGEGNKDEMQSLYDALDYVVKHDLKILEL